VPDEPAVVAVRWLSGDAELRGGWRGDVHVLELEIADLTPVKIDNMGKEEHIHTLMAKFRGDPYVH
jgi:hypothetical protein